MAEDKELLKAGEQNPKSEKERKKEEKEQWSDSKIIFQPAVQIRSLQYLYYGACHSISGCHQSGFS